MPKRILITGARDWTDEEAVYLALFVTWDNWGQPDDAILIEGECPYGGADAIARNLWESWGLAVEKVPADWSGRGKRAGPERNQVMVDRGADICIAFPGPNSRGTWDCVRRAEKAKIPVWVIKAKDA